MIVKKLLAPLINRGGILSTAEACYLATPSLTEAAFDMLMSKLPKGAKAFIVTNLEFPTEPSVLRKCLKDFSDRVTVKVYVKNVFHANVYAFDLPFRKRVAFISSANFTMEGLQKNEELSFQLEGEKAVEELKVWFERYFEESTALTTEMISHYEEYYSKVSSQQEQIQKQKQKLVDRLTGNFNWDNVDFTNQYFQREDYQAFETEEATRKAKTPVNANLEKLLSAVQTQLAESGISVHDNAETIAIEESPAQNYFFGRSKTEVKLYGLQALSRDFMWMLFQLNANHVALGLIIGDTSSGKVDRDYFRGEMKSSPKYRLEFFKLLRHLGREYVIEVAGDKRGVHTFRDQDELWNFTKLDDPAKHAFAISRMFRPDAPEISKDTIHETMKNHFQKLIALYKLMKDKKFER